MRLRIILTAALVAPLLTGCTPTSERGPRVLVFQNGSEPDSRAVITPAVLGLSLALEGSGTAVRLVGAGYEHLADDPGVVAAVVAPLTQLTPQAEDALARANLPVYSLSWLDDGGFAPSWLRLVDPLGAQVEHLAGVARRAGDRACATGDEAPGSQELLAALTQVMALQPGVATDCDVVVWTGTATGAAALRGRMGAAIQLVLADRARTDGYLEAVWPHGAGTWAVCSCVDLSTSSDPQAQSFIHDYQEFTGLDAGPWAAEGFDVGHMVLGNGTAETLGGPYDWDARGVPQTPLVRIYRATGARWLEQPAVVMQAPAG
jgi:hypothetical protein